MKKQATKKPVSKTIPVSKQKTPYNLTQRDSAESALNVGRRVFLAGLMLAVPALTFTGCKNFTERAQSPDNQILRLTDDKKSVTKYIGDQCGIWGLRPAKIEGIGLAVNLKETGSNPKPSGQREYLFGELDSKSGESNIESVLAGRDTEMVLLKGILPPGIRKGENFDIEIRTMPNSDATSIENGMILQTRLRPMAQLGRSVKQGHVNAFAKGRVLVDSLFESRTDQANQMHGYILGGGVAMEDRPIGLSVRGEDVPPKTSTMISRAINNRFTHIDSSGHRGVAEPKTDRNIELIVPEAYKHNIGRYMQVVTNLAHSESATQRMVRIEKLTQQMVDPTKSGLTSLRLEGLGNDGLPALKRALRHTDLEVKFYAAQALAYMGETDGVDHLKFVAKTEPAFRWHALTALASLEDVEAGAALADLVHVKSAETRYGAFRAIRARSPHDPLVAGQWQGDFFLHRVPSETQGMMHFSRSKRPEIVIFGEDQTVGDDFLHVESGMTVKSTGTGRVTVSRYRADKKVERLECSNNIGDVIEMLTKAGFGYGDLLKVFRNAKNSNSLNSRLVVNAVPKLGRSYVPGQSAEELPPEQSERFVATEPPELFREDVDQSGANPDAMRESKKKSEFSRRPSRLGRLEDLFGIGEKE